jgi:hypothetical protein
MSLATRVRHLERRRHPDQRRCVACCGGLVEAPEGWDGTRESLRCAACGRPPRVLIVLDDPTPEVR